MEEQNKYIINSRFLLKIISMII